MKNSKNTKRALVLSVLSVVMCMAMLIGTTFAWFTDTASTSVSNVKAGTLNLEIYGEDGQPVGDRVLTWKKAAEGADQQILWEPGCTYDLETITIRNIGELSLKYKIEITGIKGDAKLNEAIEWTIDGADLGAEYPLGVGEEKTVTISGHMKEEAGNEYQGMEITGIQIDVKAVQDTVEYDSNGNTYDENADGTPQFDGWGDKVSGSEEVVAGEDTLIKDREENPTITVQIPADTTDATSLTLMKTKTDTPAGLVESGSTYSTVKVEVLDQDGNSVTLPKGKTFVLTMQVGKGKQLVGFYRGTSKSPLTLAKSADAVKANKNQYYYDAETGIVTFSTDALNTFTVRTLNDTFAGGDGTQESPYLVATAQQALNMRWFSGYFKLVEDIVVPDEVYLSSKTYELDLNGHSIRLEYADGVKPNNGGVLNISGSNGKLTIKDSSEAQTGAVIGSDKSYTNKVTSAVRVGNYGKLDIYGGHFYGMSEATSCIYVMTSTASGSKATVNIYGGKFEVETPNANVYYVLNHQDGSTTGCTITVHGGSFKNYEPGVTVVDPVNAKTGVISVADGCTTTSEVVDGATWYTVSAN